MRQQASIDSQTPSGAKALDVPGAAQYLAVSVSKLRMDMHAGRIPFVRLGRRTVLRVEDLNAFLERNLVSGGVR